MGRDGHLSAHEPYTPDVMASRGARHEDYSTPREVRRQGEDARYTPVILKRIDEARRHPDDVLELAIEKGDEQHTRPWLSLLLSAITAGLILGFTPMAVAIAHQITHELEIPLLGRLGAALVYPLSFVFCIMGGAELFTEHTATAVYPVLERRRRIRSLLRLWLLVLVGNLIGTAITASLLATIGDVIAAEQAFVDVGVHAMSFDSPTLFVSAVLAGWLMALGAWLILTTPPTVAQIVSIYMVTFLIGFGGLLHSIAGASEVFAAAFMTDEIAFAEIARFLALAVSGNLVGGTVFVAVLNYAHIRTSQDLEAAASRAEASSGAGDPSSG